jgi:hypothetical protein
VADPAAREVGSTEVLLLALLVVGVVAGAAVLTGIVPGLQQIVFQTPLAIGVLIGGTAWLLWRIARRPPA